LPQQEDVAIEGAVDARGRRARHGGRRARAQLPAARRALEEAARVLRPQLAGLTAWTGAAPWAWIILTPMSMRGKVIPFPKFPRDPGGERGLVEVRRCDQAEALVLKGLFESQGIPTLLRSRLAHSVYPFSVGGQGEVVVLVPAS